MDKEMVGISEYDSESLDIFKNPPVMPDAANLPVCEKFELELAKSDQGFGFVDLTNPVDETLTVALNVDKNDAGSALAVQTPIGKESHNGVDKTLLYITKTDDAIGYSMVGDGKDDNIFQLDMVKETQGVSEFNSFFWIFFLSFCPFHDFRFLNK